MMSEGLNEGLNEGLKRLQDIESLQKIQVDGLDDGLDDKNRIHSLIRDDDLTITVDNFGPNFGPNLDQT